MKYNIAGGNSKTTTDEHLAIKVKGQLAFTRFANPDQAKQLAKLTKKVLSLAT